MVTGLIKITVLMKRLAGVTIAICLLFAMQPAQAGLIFDDSLLGQEILGGKLFVAEDGDVTATFLGSDASYFNTLYLISPGETFIFDKNSGSSSDESPDFLALGSFAAGTELLFRLDVDVQHDEHIDYKFYTGDGSNNPDALAHARAVTSLVDGMYVTEVGFEDLLGGGDLDYNDFMFSLNNVVDPPSVPEPSILFLLSGVLFSMIMFLRLGRRRTH